MLKIRYISSLLVLVLLFISILLFISCNLKSPQRGGIVQKDPDFRKVGTGDGALRKPSEVATFTGVKDPALAEAEEDLSVKLDKLLDTFKVPEEGKRSIAKIKDVVVNDKIGSDKSDKNYKTYADLKFYTLLNELGAFKVKDIIKFDLKIVEAQKAALEAINNVQNLQKRQSLQVVYDNKLNNYLLYLQDLFSESSANIMSMRFTSDEYCKEFTEIEIEAKRIIANGDLYEGLSGYKKGVIDGIERIVIDGSIGKDKGYKTYTSSNFRALLNELGYFKIQKIIDFYISVSYFKGKILSNIIDSIKNEVLRTNLRTRYDDKLSEYPLHLKSLFNKSSADDVYANFINDKYIDELFVIDSEAKRIVEGQLKVT
ncbi:hypothetical protein BOFE_09340 (plasmid) [Candidatus Borrelia fainii]|uniref:Lipoprotein n=1 Tax=Candidatus Borrelia fainii TaxID=2518322 RepID=A0ABM8DLD8_9SPIR|nr:hypothetical protein [Candidatus Borrelia fainii]BDU63394.1 hypothetical protein BOFE_09340 [Candidatus Borrelia fainii]